MKSVAGDIIDFPKSPAPAKVPPKEDHTSQVTVPLYLFNTMFGLLQTNGALDMDITPELVSVVPGGWNGGSLPCCALALLVLTYVLISPAEPSSL